MIVVDKDRKQYTITDFTIPYDNRIKLKKNKKIEKYHDLICELKKLWNMPVKVIILVIRILETKHKSPISWLPKSRIETKIGELQTNVILHFARIFRRVLETSGVLFTPGIKLIPLA